jgi:hypothetical protein
MLPYVRQQLANRSEDDFGDFAAEVCVPFLDRDLAVDPAGGLKLVAELEKLAMKISAGARGHW